MLVEVTSDDTKTISYLSYLFGLLFPLCAILIFLDGAEEEVDLGDNNFGK